MTIQPSLTIGDFCPWNTWEEDPNEEVFDIKAQLGFDLKKKNAQGDYCLLKDTRRTIKGMNGRASYLTDRTTGKRYLNLPHTSIRCSNLLNTSASFILGKIVFAIYVKSIANIPTPWGGLITLGCYSLLPVYNTIIKIIDTISFYHFGTQIPPDHPHNFMGRLGEAGKDLFRIVASPIFAVGLLLAPIYGILRPMDGLKLQNSLEQAFYDPSMIEAMVTLKTECNPLLNLIALGADDEERAAILQRINEVFPLVKGPRTS